MNVVKTPMSTYVLYGLAVLFLCIATFEIFTCYGDIRTLIETKNFVLSENYAYVISYYIEHCATSVSYTHLDVYKRQAYTPDYLSDEKGTTTIGSGKVDLFIVIDEENYVSDYYTEVLLSLIHI